MFLTSILEISISDYVGEWNEIPVNEDEEGVVQLSLSKVTEKILKCTSEGEETTYSISTNKIVSQDDVSFKGTYSSDSSGKKRIHWYEGSTYLGKWIPKGLLIHLLIRSSYISLMIRIPFR